MTKKDYQALARVLYEAKPSLSTPIAVETWADIQEGLAGVLQADNPRFDRARFREACETGSCKGMPKKGIPKK